MQIFKSVVSKNVNISGVWTTEAGFLPVEIQVVALCACVEEIATSTTRVHMVQQPT